MRLTLITSNEGVNKDTLTFLLSSEQYQTSMFHDYHTSEMLREKLILTTKNYYKNKYYNLCCDIANCNSIANCYYPSAEERVLQDYAKAKVSAYRKGACIDNNADVKELLSIHSSSPEACLELGCIYQLSGQYDKARDFYYAAQSLLTGRSYLTDFLYFKLGCLFVEKSRNNKFALINAKRYFDKISSNYLETKKNDPALHFAKTKIAIASGDKRLARYHLDIARTLRPFAAS